MIVTLSQAQVSALLMEMREHNALDVRVEETNLTTGTIYAVLIGRERVEFRHLLIGEGGAVLESAAI